MLRILKAENQSNSECGWEKGEWARLRMAAQSFAKAREKKGHVGRRGGEVTWKTWPCVCRAL